MSEPLTYLDYAATAPLRPEVADAMAAVLAEPLGNPTGSHPAAQRARRLLATAATIRARRGSGCARHGCPR